MIKIRKNYRLKNETIGYLEYICKSTGLKETEALEKSIFEYHNSLIKIVHTNVHTLYVQPSKDVVISPTPIHAHAHLPEIADVLISKEGLKGGISFFINENGKEIPTPVSSPELDDEHEKIEAEWKKEYEASLKARGITE